MMMTARSPGVGAERLRASRSRHASGEPLGAAAFKSKTVPRTRAVEPPVPSKPSAPSEPFHLCLNALNHAPYGPEP